MRPQVVAAMDSGYGLFRLRQNATGNTWTLTSNENARIVGCVL